MPLFPAPEKPFATHLLPVTGGHALYLEEHGNPQGQPLLMLHGGPGGGLNKKHPQYADLERFRVILFDQRGCGQSRWPGQGTAADLAGRLQENTTAHLVEDIEAIRTYLKIARWHVYGASWGSTLALAYAQAYPQAVRRLIVSAVFACNRAALAWFCQPPSPYGGMARFYPDAYHALTALLPPETPADQLPAAALAAMLGPDAALSAAVVRAWSFYECLAMTMEPDYAMLDAMLADPAWLLPHSLIECHYMAHHWFLTEDQLFHHAPTLMPIKTTILHSQYDMVCPPDAARRLHALLPETSTLQVLPTGGHMADDLMLAARMAAIAELPVHD